MRYGQNPAKFITEVAHPQDILVAVVTYIPFLSGYYAHSLEVLKVCLDSIRLHTVRPFDLAVFDNASCPEVTGYLNQLKENEKIQYLVLSDKNVGKVGAWNFIFGAAQAEYIAYSDGDVYYYPGWLPRHLEIFKAFPEAGTVCGLPRRGRRTFYTNTLNQLARLPDVHLEEGKFIDEAWLLDHARSLGKLDEIQEDLGKIDYRITRNGVSAYATATHFQFMVRSKTVRQFLPFDYDRPMGESVAHFDEAINNSNLLRLATCERLVRHLGNTLDEETCDDLPGFVQDSGRATFTPKKARNPARFFEWRPVRRVLLALYDRIFRLYYGHKI